MRMEGESLSSAVGLRELNKKDQTSWVRLLQPQEAELALEGVGDTAPQTLLVSHDWGKKMFYSCKVGWEKTDFSAGTNLPWRWCSFTLPADVVCSILSLSLKSLLIVVQLHQPRVQGRMQSSPERQEDPGRAHLPRISAAMATGDPGLQLRLLSDCSSFGLPRAFLPFSSGGRVSDS